MEAYLDNAATTKVFSEVIELMEKVMAADFGNPSSKHTKGLDAENYIKTATEVIAGSLKCKPKEIIYTSGGTESNNMAFIGTAIANRRAGKHIITTRIEHASVHEPLAFLEELGYEITYLPVDNMGHISVKDLEDAIRDDTFLVSVMYVNNEVGSVEPIEEIGRILAKQNHKILFHVDAIQAYGKYKIVPSKLGIDMMSVSGHKIHGPKGIGFLYVRENVKIRPIIFGGGQQKGMRSGTENVPGIAGLGMAVNMIYEKNIKNRRHLYELKKRLISELLKFEDITINALTEEVELSAPHIVSVSFLGVRSEVMLHALADRGVYVSSGSACSSNHPELSGTLKAIGVKDELLDSTLRFSFSIHTTEEEIVYAAEQVGQLLPMMRKFKRY